MIFSIIKKSKKYSILNAILIDEFKIPWSGWIYIITALSLFVSLWGQHDSYLILIIAGSNHHLLILSLAWQHRRDLGDDINKARSRGKFPIIGAGRVWWDGSVARTKIARWRHDLGTDNFRIVFNLHPSSAIIWTWRGWFDPASHHSVIFNQDQFG